MMIEEVEIGLFAVDIGEPLNDFEREQEKRDRTDVGMRLMSDLSEAWGVNNKDLWNWMVVGAESWQRYKGIRPDVHSVEEGRRQSVMLE